MINIFFFSYSNNGKNNQRYKTHVLDTLDRTSNLIHYNPFDENIHDKYTYNERLLKKIRSLKKIDLFFSMGNDLTILPETIDEIKKLGIPTVNFSCDNIERPFDLVKCAKHFDYLWIPEKEAIGRFKSYGANPIHLPMASNPNIFKQYNEEKEIYNAVFVGFKNSSRPKYIYELLEKNLDVNVWGYGRKDFDDSAKKRALSSPLNTLKYILKNILYPEGRLGIYADILNIFKEPKPSQKVQAYLNKSIHGELSFEDMIKLYSQAKISLGFNERGNTYQLKKPLYQIRLRDFEAPMCGACYLMYRIPEMLEYFKEDEEMLFYSSIDELIDKIKFYTQDKNELLRKKIRQKGRNRAVRDHTREKRFNDLFKLMNI